MKKIIIIALSIIVSSIVFTFNPLEMTDVNDSKIELKYKTFLTDFVEQQYYLAAGKPMSNERKQQIVKGILEASRQFEISPLLIAAIIDTETNFRNLIGTFGEVGYMQLRPSTAKYMIDKYPEKFKSLGYSEEDSSWIEKRLLTDPIYNILVGTAYLNHLMGTHNGDLFTAIGWYNGGGNEYYAKKVIFKINAINIQYPTI
ncbi:MAG: transglycosylase SLT domain-containing protein [Thermotogota bacterium]